MFAKLFELRNKKLKDNKKKGFTLVELIVVLVILAILAALLIPALTGYINKAKEKSITAETRQVVMAAQTLADEAYANSSAVQLEVVDDDKSTVTEGKTAITREAILNLAEVKGTIGTVNTTVSGKIKSLQYTSGGKTCTYDADAVEKYSIN